MPCLSVRTRRILALSLVLCGLTSLIVTAMQVVEYRSGIIWPKPSVVDPRSSSGPPADAVILFDGRDLSAWDGGENWEVRDGYAIARQNGITSKQAFGDCQLHLEFASPEKVEGSGQGRGNSGVYLMGRYEVQILDSFDNETYSDGQCGSIYKQQPPTVNACRKPGEWQTLDILFTAPRFDDKDNLATPGYVTVLHNGLVVHNHFELQGSTSYTEPPKYTHHAPKEPLHIQFHGNPVQFRNIWLRENVQPLIGIKPDSNGTPIKKLNPLKNLKP